MRKAMVWGAGGGIGQALTAELIAREWQVIAIGRDAAQLHPEAMQHIEVHVGDGFSVQNAVLSASYEIEEVDLWVYAAGDIASERIDKMTPESWKRIMDANLNGPFLATHYSLPLLAKHAHLFYLGAVSERLRLPGLAAYAAAKSGLEAFAETVRKEQRQRRVTVVRPGAVATPFWDKVPLRMPKDAAAPQKVAGRMLEAYESGHSGLLDLT